MSFFEVFQPGLRHLREERDRRRSMVVRPTHGGGAPLGIDLEAGTARIILPAPAAPATASAREPAPATASAREPGPATASAREPSPATADVEGDASRPTEPEVGHGRPPG